MSSPPNAGQVPSLSNADHVTSPPSAGQKGQGPVCTEYEKKGANLEPIHEDSISEDKQEVPNRKTLVRNNLIDFMTKNSSLNSASVEVVSKLSIILFLSANQYIRPGNGRLLLVSVGQQLQYLGC